MAARCASSVWSSRTSSPWPRGSSLCSTHFLNKMKPLLCVLALALMLTSCSLPGSSSNSAGPSPATFQLRLSDVPPGFYLAGTSSPSPHDTARAQGLDAAQYATRGGEASSEERFLLRDPSTNGLTFIASQVIPFQSVSDARWGFHQLRAALARSGTIGTVQETVNVEATATPLPANIKYVKHPVAPPPTLYQPERIPPLGDEDAGFHNTSAAYAGEYVFDNQVVLFRRGRYCAVVHISGNFGQVPAGDALSLAGKIDNRIRKS